MGSVPTQTFKADLNGTGTLVDITTYVADNRYGHRYGRTDWTSPAQPAGTLAVTLENLDGRFTPGSTATYAVGVVKNMCVEWTCGTRIRRFYVSVAQLDFPTGVAGNSTVTLQCRDALALLQERAMRAMVREATLAANPIAYWPMDESVSDGVVFADISGNGQPGLYPFAKEATAASTSYSHFIQAVESGYLDGGARGPRTDAAGAPLLNNQTSPIQFSPASGPLWGHRGGAGNGAADPLAPADLRRTLIEPPRATPYAWTGGGTAPTLTSYPYSGWTNVNGSAVEFVVSLWFSIKDIYGAASGTGGTDGPYVVLAEIPLGGADGQSLSIMWRTADRTIVVAGYTGWTHGTYATIARLSGDTYSVSPAEVHHLAITFAIREDAWSGAAYVSQAAVVRGVLDGVQLASVTMWLGLPQYPTGFMAGSFTVASPKMTGTTTAYALTGSISNVSIHGTDQRTAGGGADGEFPRALEIWQTGTTGPLEDAPARVDRLMAWATDLPATLALAPQGTEQIGLLGPQTTAGKDMLTAICEALASEEAALDTLTVAGVDTVRPWLDSTQRQLTPALTVNAENDGEGSPILSFDQTGVASAATVQGWSESATWTDSEAPAQWKGTRATVASGMADVADLLALAQYRTVKGRATKISPTRITIDAASSVATVTTALLALHPGATIRIEGLPSSKIGYSSIDCILVGVSERHSTGRNLFELALIPRGAELYTDPLAGTEGPWRFIDQPDWAPHPVSGVLQGSGWCGSFMGLYGSTTGGALSNVATTGYIISNRKMAPLTSPVANTIPETFFSQDSGDFPLSIKVDDEIITLPNAAGVPTSTTINGGSCWYQQVTGMQRGQQGTAAVAHGAFTPTSTSGNQNLTVYVPPENYPLLAF